MFGKVKVPMTIRCAAESEAGWFLQLNTHNHWNLGCSHIPGLKVVAQVHQLI